MDYRSLSLKKLFYILFILAMEIILATSVHSGCDPAPNASGVNNSGVVTGVTPTTQGQKTPPPETGKNDPETTASKTPEPPSKDGPKKGSKTDDAGTKPGDAGKNRNGAGYDPRDDPNLKSDQKTSTNGKDPNIGDGFQGQTPWGQKPQEGTGVVGGGDQPLPQPPEYTGEKPEERGIRRR